MPFPGQKTSYRAPDAGKSIMGAVQGAVDWLNRAQGLPVGRSAEAQQYSGGKRGLVPIRSDQLPSGAYMKETGEVFGMNSGQVPAGGYMTETGRVYVPSGFSGFERQGPSVPERIMNAPSAPVLPPYAGATPAPYVGSPAQRSVPIVQAEDDAYRQLLSQYGGLAKAGKQEEAERLGMEIWNKKYGKTAMAQPGGAVGQVNPLMADMFGRQSSASAAAPSYAGVQAQPMGSEDFARAANSVPAPWNQQGAQVSSDFAGVVPFQAAKTTGSGMPAFQTTGEKAIEFLTNMKLRNSF